MSPDDLRRLLARHDAAPSPPRPPAPAGRGAGRGDDVVLRDLPRRRITCLAVDDGSRVIAKEYRPTSAGRRLGRLLFGPRAARADRGARALRAAGFLVPEPLGWLPGRGCSVVFARRVEGPTLQEALGAADRARAQALALEAVTLAARLHLAGFAVRDLKPANLIVTAAGLCLVDLDDVGRRRPGGWGRQTWRENLVSLDAYGQSPPRPLGVRARTVALRAYAQLRGLDPGRLLRQVLPRSRRKRRGHAARG